MKIERIVKIKEYKEGSNCKVYKASAQIDGFKSEVILKLGIRAFKSDIVSKLVLKDYEKIRSNLVFSGVMIPELYYYGIGNYLNVASLTDIDLNKRVLVIEEDCGKSIKDLFNDKSLSKLFKHKILSKCRSFILTLPENIPLDTNTGNIVYSKERDSLYFIDFLPPDPWAKFDAPAMTELFEVFPTLNKLLLDKGGNKRYFRNEYRWKKFMYYLEKNSITAKKLVLR